MTDYSHRQSPQPQPNLLQRLAKIWEDLKTPQEYRMITIKYLTNLPTSQQQKYLKYEIEWNKSHQSHYQLIFRLNMRRKITLFKIKSLLKELKPFQNAKIEQLCLLLCNLRELNVQTSEKVIQMIKFYNINLEEINERKILSFLRQLINNLQVDNQTILSNQYRNLLKIDENFDPYFISYYQNQSKRSNQLLDKRFQKLYNLNINEVYTVISLKHKIQLIMTTIDYRLNQLQNASKRSYYLKRAKNRSSPSQFPRNQTQNISKTGRKYHFSSRSHSHDHTNMISSQDKREIIRNHFKSSDKFCDQSNNLGKIVRNITNSPKESIAFKANKNDKGQYIFLSKKDQDHSEHKVQKLNLIQLQPINIKIQKLQNIASPQGNSLPLKQVFQERQENTHQSQFLEYSHIKITKFNKLSRKNVQSFKPQQKNLKKRYDFNQNNMKGNRIPGFIKNSKANIFEAKDSEMGFYEQNPISNKGIKTAKTETAAQYSSNQEIDNVGQPSRQTSIIEIISRQTQTQRKSSTKHHKIKVKVDIDCQTQLEENNMYGQINDEQSDESESQRQECNNKQQHQQAVYDFQNEEKKLSDSLVTLEQQYFVDERTTPIKKYKIPMIRTITEEETGFIQKQKKSVANYINNKQKNKQPERPQIEDKSKQNVEEPSSSNMTLTMKIGKCTYQEVLGALQAYKINSKFAKIFEISKLKQHIKNCHTYVLEYLINDQIAVIALVSPIPRSTIVLKLWGPMQNIDQNTSEKLFLKYVNYLSTNVNKIVYKGICFDQLIKAGFVNKRNDIFERVNQKTVQNNTQFEEFFSVKCSNINSQEEAQINFEQNDGQLFDQNNYYCAQFIRKVKLSNLSQQISDLFIEEKNVASFQQVNKILKEQQYQHSYKQKMPQARKESINLLLFQFNSPMKTNFIVQNGQFFVDAIVNMQEKEKLIVSVPLTKNNSYVYFGKGMSIAQFNSFIQTQPKRIGNDKCRIKMFSKILQGSLTNKHQFGHWQISFVFEDQIKSASIKHSPNVEKQFGSSPFMVALELEKQILYSVIINKEDLQY